MLVTNVSDPSHPVEISFLEQPLPLARDIFLESKLRRATVERTVTIIKGFLAHLKELGGGLETIKRAVTTNILVESSNNDSFLTRISVATGINLEILDDGEMTRLIYLKTRRRLRETPSMKKRTTLLIHVGPGNTRAILFRKGKIVRYTSYRLGAYRAIESIEQGFETSEIPPGVIRRHCQAQVDQIRYEYQKEEVQDLVIIGYEVQHLSSHLTLKSNDSEISIEALKQVITRASKMNDDQMVNHFQIDYEVTPSLLAALVINHQITEAFQLSSLRVPGSDFEKGLLLDLPSSPSLSQDFSDEVLRSATILAKKYQTHPKHSLHVASLCEQLFEATTELHQLDPRDHLLLKVASIVHEVGGYISARAHHKHSLYLILNSEIFGLGKKDVTMVGLVARYHRQSAPKPGHEIYRDLSQQDRIRVCKLASIIRIADALEKTHSQRIKRIEVHMTPQKLKITCIGIHDLTAENMAIQQKSDLFEKTFGMKVSLKEDPNLISST